MAELKNRRKQLDSDIEHLEQTAEKTADSKYIVIKKPAAHSQEQEIRSLFRELSNKYRLNRMFGYMHKKQIKTKVKKKHEG